MYERVVRLVLCSAEEIVVAAVCSRKNAALLFLGSPIVSSLIRTQTDIPQLRST